MDSLTWAELGRLQDRLEVLEQREVQYQKFIYEGLQQISQQRADMVWAQCDIEDLHSELDFARGGEY